MVLLIIRYTLTPFAFINKQTSVQTGFLFFVEVCTPIMSTYRTFINFVNFDYIHVLIFKNEK